MTTDTGIEPALTAREWAEVVREEIRIAIPVEIRPRLPIAPRWAWENAGIVALANHSLPDDDLRKLRREDVVNLRAMLELAKRYVQTHPQPSGAKFGDDHILQLVNAELAVGRIAALLPPDKWAAYNEARADLPNQRL